MKGLTISGDRYSFIANSAIEEKLENSHSLTLHGFGQITKKSVAGSQAMVSLKEIILKYNESENILNIGSVKLTPMAFLHVEEQNFEYLNCHFEGVNSKGIKLYKKVLDAFKIKK